MSSVGGCVFFFQAEDGIRDLVRSRGLGDVYKRQEQCRARRHGGVDPTRGGVPGVLLIVDGHEGQSIPVSYTHLTLPTSDLV